MLRSFVRGYSDLSHSYSKTLHLPKTKFPKRSNYDKSVKDLIPRSSQLLYKQQLAERPTDENVFILHDGPPYANGDLHLGHSLNKILKDLVNRYQLLLGKKVYYKPGWDCHGLPIELKALEKLDLKLKKDSSTVLPVKKIRGFAKDHALKTIKKQLEKFREFAILTDFEHNYKTLNHDFEIRQLKVFKELLDKGLIRRQKKPVYWGCETHTALAESELEYNDKHRSTAAFIKFPIIEPSPKFQKVLSQNDITGSKLLIWTSTPWTIPSNRAICVNEHSKYTFIKEGSLIVDLNLIDQVIALNPQFTKSNIVFAGSDIIGSKYANPITPDVVCPVLHGNHVTNTSGTGLVHTAPGHGNDDYFVCVENGIEAYSPVDQFGQYTNELPEGFKHLVGKKVLKEGNKEIIEVLKQKDMIYHIDSSYIHSYPYDWRSKQPVIIRATPQWFCNVGEIKDKAIKALEEVKFIPDRGSNRLLSFVKNRNEWCISRQRSWGVPIPALYSKTDENLVLMDNASVSHIISKINELGTDAWFDDEKNVERWLPESHRGLGAVFTKGKDTMDVWFDSGSSWTDIETYIRENTLDRDYLADVYLEGSDQHRGWFQSSLLTKIGTSSEVSPKAPYRAILTHGFTLDEKGHKMSKSIGNTVSPDAVIKGDKELPGVGVDGLRFWVAQSDYTTDVTLGPNILKHVGDAMKKLRITFTYLLGNLNDLPQSELVEYDNLRKIDQYALSKLALLNQETLKYYEEYNFSRALKTIINHINVDSSSIYFDIIKDRLYTDATDSLSRRSAQTVLVKTLKVYSTLLSPITPLVTQEVWDYTHDWIKDGTVHPNVHGVVDLKQYRKVELEEEFDRLWTIRDALKILSEKGRQAKEIRSTLETDIYINLNEQAPSYELLQKYQDELNDLFISAHVKINESIPEEGYDYTGEVSIDGTKIKLSVKPSTHSKCPRCWKFTANSETELCQRCDTVVNQ